MSNVSKKMDKLRRQLDKHQFFQNKVKEQFRQLFFILKQHTQQINLNNKSMGDHFPSHKK
jgi:hypothetical protein